MWCISQDMLLFCCICWVNHCYPMKYQLFVFLRWKNEQLALPGITRDNMCYPNICTTSCYPGISNHILFYPGISLLSLLYPGISNHILFFPGISLLSLFYPGISQDIQNTNVIQRDIPAFVRI